MENLYTKTISSGIWNIIEKFGSQFIQFVIGIFLARLLLPEEFGLIAMLMIFIRISQVIIESGFSVALIQRQGITEEDCSTVFYFNLTCAITTYLLLVALSPLIAIFYHQPQLAPILRILGTVLIIGSLSEVHGTLLTKDLKFRALFMARFSAIVISAIVAVIMALQGYGVWTLVGQQITLFTCRTFGLWFLSAWYPKFIFCFKSLRSLFSFGSKLLGTWLMNAIFDNLYPIVIGKIFSPAELGFYSRGRSLPMLLMNTTNGVIGSVMLPVFSRLQNEPHRFRNALRRTVKICFFWTCPLLAGTLITANTLVEVLLTAKWLPCVPVLQWICIAFMFYPIHIVNLQALVALGRTDVFFKIEMIKKTMVVLSLLATYRFGIVYMAAGQAMVYLLATIIHGIANRKYIQYTFSEQILDIMHPLIISMVMCVIVYYITLSSIVENIYLLLATQAISGAMVYIMGSFILKSAGLHETLSAIRTLQQKRGPTNLPKQ